MLSHLRHFVGRQRGRLVQDVIRNADLADVVQRGEAGEQIDPFRREIVAVVRVGGQLLRQNPRV